MGDSDMDGEPVSDPVIVSLKDYVIKRRSQFRLPI